MTMHHHRRGEFGYIQAKQKIFYIDLLGIRLFPFGMPSYFTKTSKYGKRHTSLTKF